MHNIFNNYFLQHPYMFRLPYSSSIVIIIIIIMEYLICYSYKSL